MLEMETFSQNAVSTLINPKHRITDKLFKYQRVITKRENKKPVAADTFIIAFVVDAVFQVLRQILWATSHVVTKERFKIPTEDLQNQLYLLGKYEHKIRIALSDQAKIESNFIDDIRQLRHDSEQFLEQLEQKWYINLWLHEKEIMEEFEAIHEAIEEIKCTIIDSLLDCIEVESTLSKWSMVPMESREHKESHIAKVEGQVVQWDHI